MSQAYPHVFTPIRVAGHFLKNRIISAPSTVHSASNGEPYPTEKGIRFFEDRAKAGVGLVTCAGVSVGGAFDDGVHCSWDVSKRNHTNRLADLVERIHFYGAKCTMELIGVFPDGYTVCDGCSIMGGPAGRFIPALEMMKFKQAYIDAAAALQEIGFDGVMLHFGHSIPVAQFLSPLTNRRADEYGGSVENRCRYPREILAGIRAAVGKGMILDVRISGSEFESGGIDRDEGLRIAELLQENADILQVSAGMHNPDWMTWTHPCGFLPPLPNVHLAEAFKKSGRIRIPVSTIGGIGSLRDADAILADGKADFVVIARAFIADIGLIAKSRDGREADVTPCVKCMRCHDSDNYARHMICTVNPRVGMERRLETLPAPQRKKRVAVIGGGPAGMTAAVTAAQRGHGVTLFEKAGSLGGKLNFADFAPFKYPLATYKNWLIHQLEKSTVEVKLNAEARPGDMKPYDAVIAAVGSEPLALAVPGASRAINAVDVYGNEHALGERVAVIGGGEVGLETALHLARQGRELTLLEMRPALAQDASKTHRDELLTELRKEGARVRALTEAACARIDGGAVFYEKDGGTHKISADSVICAIGMRALTARADSFMGLTDEYAQAGDCVRARSVEWAVKEGYFAALVL
ncbi:MAG: FAD-dependent oxidoreductase [Clostridiales Family XIII bacterium]|jgi:2,4-dienoyl-CoA reductase-like NADH-dependent reductase (Old Yellow Enzyme family)/thioredoxin reductase|nr:FAD-dependent oxidoreductase [Clostridiales Family XIII bacterium]